MRDLDMSDVLEDANRLEQDYYDYMYRTHELADTPTLEQWRYQLGIVARETSFPGTIMQLRMIDDILLSRLVTTLCEVCLGRTGCDMCNPDYSYLYDDGYDMQHAHYEQFGRPAFPNEY